MSTSDKPDLFLENGRFSTLDPQSPQAEAVAIRGGRFSAVGSRQDVMSQGDDTVPVIDLRGRRAIPGLIDSHMHIIRGGLNYNMELRWDGLRSLAGMAPRTACGCAHRCSVHGHAHATAWGADVPVADRRQFWGALGCSCWAF